MTHSAATEWVVRVLNPRIQAGIHVNVHTELRRQDNVIHHRTVGTHVHSNQELRRSKNRSGLRIYNVRLEFDTITVIKLLIIHLAFGVLSRHNHLVFTWLRLSISHFIYHGLSRHGEHCCKHILSHTLAGFLRELINNEVVVTRVGLKVFTNTEELNTVVSRDTLREVGQVRADLGIKLSFQLTELNLVLICNVLRHKRLSFHRVFEVTNQSRLVGGVLLGFKESLVLGNKASLVDASDSRLDISIIHLISHADNGHHDVVTSRATH